MDHFGIGQALKGMILAYQQAARRTGRTTSLLSSLKDGDRVCCMDQRQANLLDHECRNRGLKVQIIVVPPEYPERLYSLSPIPGRTLFDHTWVERFYELAFTRAQDSIDHMQKILSGSSDEQRQPWPESERGYRWPLEFSPKKLKSNSKS